MPNYVRKKVYGGYYFFTVYFFTVVIGAVLQ